MIDAVEPLSIVLWSVFFLAAGMYPLGYMLGAPCSQCCGGDCEPLFYRCLRQKSVGRSLPYPASQTIYFLKDAGIIKASSKASANAGLSIGGHGYLSAGEFVQYVVPAQAIIGSDGYKCPNATQAVTVRVEGRDFPLKFRDVPLGVLYAGTSFSKTGVAGATTDDFTTNVNASVSASVVGASVSVGGAYFDGTEMNDSVLRGMLAVSQPTFEQSIASELARVPTVSVSLSGNGNLFRYITATCFVTWLVEVRRGSTTTYFRVSATVYPLMNPASVPSGTTTATITPLPSETIDTPTPEDSPPVVHGSMVTAKSHVRSSYSARVAITVPLTGRCTVYTDYIEWGTVARSGFEPPAVFGNQLDTAGRYPVSLPLDKYAFRIEHLVNEPAGEEYDPDLVDRYRRGEVSLPVKYRRQRGATEVIDRYEMQIAEPSPLCGLDVCWMPQDLLPQGITYTPAAGKKWDCKDAFPLVLGNPRGGCIYTHDTNECRGVGSAGINLVEFYTPFTIPADGLGAPYGTRSLDALTWLEFTPGVVTKPEGTYEIKGTYDAGAHKYGLCYTSSVADKTFQPGVGGVCQPAEYTVTINGFTPLTGHNAAENDTLREILDEGDVKLANYVGDYVLNPVAGGCRYSWYEGGQFDAGYRLIHIQMTNFHGTGWGAPSPVYGFGSVDMDFNMDFNCDAISRQAVTITPERYGLAFTGHSPAIGQYESGYDSIPGALYVGPGIGVAAYTRCSISTSAGSPMTQCKNMKFAPTEITREFNSYVDSWLTLGPNGSDVTVSGDNLKCGYGILDFSGRVDTDNLQRDYSLDKSIFTTYTPRDTPFVVKRTMFSPGSPPQVVTITVPGKCQSITTTTGNTYGQGPITAPRAGGCVVITVVPTGPSCAWTATGGSEWAVIDDQTKSGVGVGLVKVQVLPWTRGVRRSRVTLTLTADSTKTVQAEIYQG
jgi:hypothetical protein